jgi:hypothetical protein
MKKPTEEEREAEFLKRMREFDHDEYATIAEMFQGMIYAAVFVGFMSLLIYIFTN